MGVEFIARRVLELLGERGAVLPARGYVDVLLVGPRAVAEHRLLFELVVAKRRDDAHAEAAGA